MSSEYLGSLSLSRRRRFRDRVADRLFFTLSMPIMDGITATKKIRSMEASGELSWRSSIFGLTGKFEEDG